MVKKDISDLLNSWPFDPEVLNVRKITGGDGIEKIQLRLDLGLLQMETTGRPDGSQPHGFESLLDFYRDTQQTQDGPFHLDPDDLRSLQQESIQYYHRYLCYAELDDHEGVIRDTSHNLETLEFVEEFAPDEETAWAFMQYYPYVKMMHTQAKVQLALEHEIYNKALDFIDTSIQSIREFNTRWKIEDSPEATKEIQMLEEWRETVNEKKPLSKSEKLQEDLEEAVRLERYEDAARIRDKLAELQSQN